MLKRPRDNLDGSLHFEPPSAKRTKSIYSDRISNLPEEILLRILSYLPAKALVICQLLSQRFAKMAIDSQLWKERYYQMFIRPRLRRSFGSRGRTTPEASNKVSQSSFEELTPAPVTDWKALYRLRYNWTQGFCEVTQMQITDQNSSPDYPLAQIYSNIVIIVDALRGLQVWDLESRRLVSSIQFHSALSHPRPTSLSVDGACKPLVVIIAVGFQNGDFSIYRFTALPDLYKYQMGLSNQPSENHFLQLLVTHISIVDVPLTAIACKFPTYVATLHNSQYLSLYMLKSRFSAKSSPEHIKVLASLKAHAARAPISLNIRALNDIVIVSMAYPLPTFLSGWTVGLQEIKFTSEGSVFQSRVASATDQRFVSLDSRSESLAVGSGEFHESRLLDRASKLTSLAYSHPYVLVSHSDNTLAVYLAYSSDTALSIGAPHRLWGHTSGIADVQIGDKGKAISVSSTGCEIRIWELEGIHRGTRGKSQNGVEIKPKLKMSKLNKVLENSLRISGTACFNEERILLVREDAGGSRNLLIYDFK